MVALKPSDVVLVTKLDRLGRSTRELLDVIDRIERCRIPLGSASAVGHLEPARRLLSTLLAAIASAHWRGRRRAMIWVVDNTDCPVAANARRTRR